MLKNIYKSLDRIIRRFLPELSTDAKSLRYLVQKKAIESSADFVATELKFAEPFQTREGLFYYLFNRILDEGMILEFGVHRGASINILADMTSRTIHGFDNFEGLPNDGDIPTYNDGGSVWYADNQNNEGPGEMGQLPEVNNNVQLHKGWFDKQLPRFFEEYSGPISFIHIDCDIYSSTKCVLENCKDRLQQGTLILFDELINYVGWQKHEYRALTEFVEATNMRYEYIGYTYLGGVAIRVLDIDSTKIDDLH